MHQTTKSCPGAQFWVSLGLIRSHMASRVSSGFTWPPLVSPGLAWSHFVSLGLAWPPLVWLRSHFDLTSLSLWFCVDLPSVSLGCRFSFNLISVFINGKSRAQGRREGLLQNGRDKCHEEKQEKGQKHRNAILPGIRLGNQIACMHDMKRKRLPGPA